VALWLHWFGILIAVGAAHTPTIARETGIACCLGLEGCARWWASELSQVPSEKRSCHEIEKFARRWCWLIGLSLLTAAAWCSPAWAQDAPDEPADAATAPAAEAATPAEGLRRPADGPKLPQYYTATPTTRLSRRGRTRPAVRPAIGQCRPATP